MSEKRREITGLLIIAIGILVFLSLVSYNPNEEPTISARIVIQNWMGIIGVYLSHYLIKYTLGFAAFVFPVLIILWGWWIFSRRELRKLLRFSIYFLVLALGSSVALALGALKQLVVGEPGFRYSGLLGGMLAKLAVDFIGFYGIVILLAVLGLVILRGLIPWNFYSPLARLREKRKQRKGQKKSRKEQRKRLESVVKIDKGSDSPGAIVLGSSQPGIEARIEERLKPSKSEKKPLPPFGEKAKQRLEKRISEAEEDDGLSLEEKKRQYQLPSIDLLDTIPTSREQVSKEEIMENAKLLENALETFNVQGRVVNVSPGPIITRYEIEPASGVRVSKIASLADDLARILEAQRVRIVAPIPGTSVVGIEIPNRHPAIVSFKSVVSSSQFINAPSKLTVALGQTTSGEVYTFDLARMPHLLIAGATGSGKSVCINTIIASYLYRAKPDEIKFVLIDPKKLELSLYKILEGYHLITSEDLDEFVITKAENAIVALRSVEMEMERRYELLAGATVRSIDEYNQRIARGEIDDDHLPYIVLIIDELADLILSSAKEVEAPITRLAQMARAVGIHLVIATQRPSVNVITGVIKANFPARIALQVASKIDSRTILDANGAEKLLGRGDLLITTSVSPEPVRLHSAFISLPEIERILNHISQQPKLGEVQLPSVQEAQEGEFAGLSDDDRDELYQEALKLVVTHQQGSISLLQRRLRIGYSRAARLIDQLERSGIVGPFTGSKARDVLVEEDYLESLQKLDENDGENF